MNVFRVVGNGEREVSGNEPRQKRDSEMAMELKQKKKKKRKNFRNSDKSFSIQHEWAMNKLYTFQI